MPEKTKACECEHKKHFETHSHEHEYGKEYPENQLVEISTAFGKFRVCSDCSRTCAEQKR